MEFAVLAAARLASAAVNIVHDCDEVYNYWEPLHYMLHGYGMQTWEYSSRYALRSYLYILLHSIVGYPAGVAFGGSHRKLFVFYAIRAALALLCAFAEWRLVSAARKYLGPAGSWTLTMLLCLSAGSFLAPSTLLPSTFMMYCMTWAATGVLNRNTTEVVVAAAVGVTLGWPVAGVALLPYALYVLFAGRLLRSVAVLVVALGALLLAIFACDLHFYGRPTLSLWNFVLYNVAGGGESALYGVEPAHFYLLNGLLNFNSALLLALAFPLVAALQACRAISRPAQWILTVAISPLFVWLAAISALPHKEERFLYVVYPHIALAATATLVTLPRLLSDLPALFVRLSAPTRDRLRSVGVAAVLALLAQTLLTSLSRVAAVLSYYQAPMTVWTALSHHEAACPLQSADAALVCTGAEWYRYPSSFFLPSPRHRLAFLDSPFDGLLPKAYDKASGGTRAAPAELNDRNRKHPALVLSDPASCAFLVEMTLPGQASATEGLEGWRLLHEAQMVDKHLSPFPARAFWWPGSFTVNTLAPYRLWRNDALLAKCSEEESS